jgi:hypothetical protein
MECLRCRTPKMAIKELWAYLLAYNLIGSSAIRC